MFLSGIPLALYNLFLNCLVGAAYWGGGVIFKDPSTIMGWNKQKFRIRHLHPPSYTSVVPGILNQHDYVKP